jgi:hypothetical protein
MAARYSENFPLRSLNFRKALGLGWTMDFSSPGWTDAELDESILKLCDEFPDSPMVACSRAIEYCRRMTPRGTPEQLLTAMRGALHHGAPKAAGRSE